MRLKMRTEKVNSRMRVDEVTEVQRVVQEMLSVPLPLPPVWQEPLAPTITRSDVVEGQELTT